MPLGRKSYPPKAVVAVDLTRLESGEACALSRRRPVFVGGLSSKTVPQPMAQNALFDRSRCRPWTSSHRSYPCCRGPAHRSGSPRHRLLPLPASAKPCSTFSVHLPPFCFGGLSSNTVPQFDAVELIASCAFAASKRALPHIDSLRCRTPVHRSEDTLPVPPRETVQDGFCPGTALLCSAGKACTPCHNRRLIPQQHAVPGPTVSRCSIKVALSRQSPTRRRGTRPSFSFASLEDVQHGLGPRITRFAPVVLS